MFDKTRHFDLTEKIKSKIATYKTSHTTEKSDLSRASYYREATY